MIRRNIADCRYTRNIVNYWRSNIDCIKGKSGPWSDLETGDSAPSSNLSICIGPSQYCRKLPERFAFASCLRYAKCCRSSIDPNDRQGYLS